MIVAQGIGVGELAEIRRVASSHIIKAHCDCTLIGARRRIGAVLRALPRGLGYPDKEIALPAMDLLPHLEKAVNRAARVVVVRERRVHIEWAVEIREE